MSPKSFVFYLVKQNLLSIILNKYLCKYNVQSRKQTLYCNDYHKTVTACVQIPLKFFIYLNL